MSRFRYFVLAVSPVLFSSALNAQPGWTDQFVPGDPALIQIDFVNADTGWVTGTGTLSISVDGGNTWTNKAPTPIPTYTSILAVTVDSVWVADSGGRLWWTFDAGESWEFFRLPGGSFADLARNSQGVFLAAAFAPPPVQGPIYRSENGTDWDVVNDDTDRRFLFGMAFGDDSTAWAAGSDGVILKTTDTGTAWTRQQSGIGDVNKLFFANAETGWGIGNEGEMIFTGDGGETWELRDSGVDVNLLDITFTTPERGWVVGNSGTIIFTVDGGVSWTELEPDTEKRFTGVSFPDPDHGWVAGNTQFSATGGILRTTSQGSTVATDLETPARLGQVQAYPNPFSSYTVLSFEFEKPSHLVMDVMNLLGRRVSTVDFGYRSAGAQKITFHAADLPTGHYFYRLRSESGSRSGKMVLAR